jgi:hypothetical protein
MLDNDILDSAIIFTLFSKHDELDKYPHLNYDPVEELRRIKETPYYMLVATTRPTEMMKEVYANPYDYIALHLSEYVRMYEILRRNLQEAEVQNGLKKKELDRPEFKKRTGLDTLNFKQQQEIENAIRINSAYMRYKLGTSENVMSLEQFIRTNKLHDEPTFMAKFIPIYETARINDEAVKGARKALEDHDNEYTRRFDRMLIEHGFVHSIGCSLNYAEAKQFVDGSNINYPYAIMHVMFADASVKDLPSHKLNRLFFDEAGARGTDLPLEAVLITRSFEGYKEGDVIPDYMRTKGRIPDGASVDSILQMTGRCGRPSLSKISIVYMSADCYDRILNETKSSDTRSAMMRTKYYRQDVNENNITGPVAKREEDTRLFHLMRDVFKMKLF